MASLSQRLRSLQIPASKMPESLDHLRLEDLENETISFGQKHQGHSFQEAWLDQEWVHFMLGRYQNSTKESHRRFLKYVELRVEEMENSQTVLPPRQTSSQGNRAKAKPKPGAKTMATPSLISLQDGGRRLGCGVRDVHPSDYGLCHQPHDRGSHSLADPDVEHGKCVDARDQAHRGPGLAEQCQPGERDGLRDPWNSDKPASMPANVEGLESEIKGIKEDWDNHVFTSMSSETSELWRLVGQITSEMQDVLQQTKPMGSRWTLGEVMCSSKSPITQQVLNSGQQAFRFGLDQGDLSTSAGRCLLFRKIAQHRPRHVWYSPTCGPWSSWSQLNAARSMQHQQEYNQMRKDLLYQIAWELFFIAIKLFTRAIFTGNNHRSH